MTGTMKEHAQWGLISYESIDDTVRWSDVLSYNDCSYYDVSDNANLECNMRDDDRMTRCI